MKSLDIYKLLPKTNCGKCGFATCLAFAMRLSAQKSEPALCPYLSDDARVILEQQTRAPIKEIVFENIKLGGETVMYRHEKKFFSPPPFAILLKDTLTDFELKNKINFIRSLKISRLGEVLQPELVALEVTDFEKSRKLLEKLNSLNKQVLYIGNIDAISKLLPIKKGIIWGKDALKSAEISKAAKVPAVVSAKSVSELKEISKKAKSSAAQDIILNVESEPEFFSSLVEIRKEAVVNGSIELGYPVVSRPNNLEQALFAVAKYSSLVVLENFPKEEIFALLTLRQNIFTDPQKPIQVEPGIYDINNPKKDSPVLVTTNFSLTFFNLKSDLENSKFPAYLLVVDTEGLSVLTAWAAGKFSPEKIAGAISNFKLQDKTSSKKLIIPGLVAMISGELEEKSGYKVLVGPKDSSALPAYLKTITAKTAK